MMLQILLAEHKSHFKPNKSENEQMKELQAKLDTYVSSKESSQRMKFNLLAKKIGLNTNHLTYDECQILMKDLEKSDVVKQGKGGRRK